MALICVEQVLLSAMIAVYWSLEQKDNRDYLIKVMLDTMENEEEYLKLMDRFTQLNPEWVEVLEDFLKE
jgi:hypothetical protein